jgi:hypothetical protein
MDLVGIVIEALNDRLRLSGLVTNSENSHILLMGVDNEMRTSL